MGGAGWRAGDLLMEPRWVETAVDAPLDPVGRMCDTCSPAHAARLELQSVMIGIPHSRQWRVRVRSEAEARGKTRTKKSDIDRKNAMWDQRVARLIDGDALGFLSLQRVGREREGERRPIVDDAQLRLENLPFE